MTIRAPKKTEPNSKALADAIGRIVREIDRADCNTAVLDERWREMRNDISCIAAVGVEDSKRLAALERATRGHESLVPWLDDENKRTRESLRLIGGILERNGESHRYLANASVIAICIGLAALVIAIKAVLQ